MIRSPGSRNEPEVLRGFLFHTPRSPFAGEGALETFSDGALVIRDGKIAACGHFSDLREAHPDARVIDRRGCFLLPGFVDTHVHFPQVRVLGGLGLTLLDWLDRITLPEEARFADEGYAAMIAGQFAHLLAAHGTTTALVFGSHFAPATAALFASAEARGLRVISGLVLSDRMLRTELHRSPDAAYQDSKQLIAALAGRPRLLYAVTPRFALSSSEAMLDVCRTLLREHPEAFFQTHINESPREVAAVAQMFPWAQDYLAVYERFSLLRRGSVLAHSVHSSDGELARMALHGASVSHCPCSNAALGSGFFPMRRHLTAGVRFGLGTDVGGGTGFGLLKESLQAYLLQTLAPGGYPLQAPHLLYLATRAGAEALGLEEEIGDFGTGKSADVVCLSPPSGSALESIAADNPDPARLLAAIFTAGDSAGIVEVRVAGRVVHDAA